jgi:hypothetical protein
MSAVRKAKMIQLAQNRAGAITDNLTYFQRAGQRCLSVIFGASSAEIEGVVLSQKGASTLGRDLVEEVRRAVQSIDLENVPSGEYMSGGQPSAAPLPFENEDIGDMRAILLKILSCVEVFLRHGEYAGGRLTKENKPPCGALERLRAVRERGADGLLKEGLATTEAEAQLAADAALSPVADILRARQISQAKRSITQELNHEAFECCSNLVCDMLCTGTAAINHQLDLDIFMCSKSASAQCASCEKPVHILEACSIKSGNERCKRCGRPRCLKCQLSKTSDLSHCRRCRVR